MYRKIMIVFIIFMVLAFVGCADYSKPPSTNEMVIIDGHRYKVLRGKGNFGQTYVHDPECLMEDISKILKHNQSINSDG